MKTNALSLKVSTDLRAAILSKRVTARRSVATLVVIGFCSSSVIAQLPDWPDPVANHVVPYQSLGITHGPILGGVTSSSVKIWIRTMESMPFEILVSERIPFDGAARFAGQTNPSQDYTGWVNAEQLKPNTRYYYAVQLKGEIVDTRSGVDQPWGHEPAHAARAAFIYQSVVRRRTVFTNHTFQRGLHAFREPGRLRS